MTLTLSRPRGLASIPTARRARAADPCPGRSKRDAIEHEDAIRAQTTETRRITVCCGCHLIGIYPAGALAEVLADLSRWAVDPAARDPLPWPVRCAPWEWCAGETLAVWHAGQVVALVAKPAAGGPVITRIDRPAAAE